MPAFPHRMKKQKTFPSPSCAILRAKHSNRKALHKIDHQKRSALRGMDLRGFWRGEMKTRAASAATPAKARGTQPIGVSIGSQSNPTDDMKTQPDQAWSDAADAMLTELRGRGLGNSEIAREMGRGRRR